MIGDSDANGKGNICSKILTPVGFFMFSLLRLGRLGR